MKRILSIIFCVTLCVNLFGASITRFLVDFDTYASTATEAIPNNDSLTFVKTYYKGSEGTNSIRLGASSGASTTGSVETKNLNLSNQNGEFSVTLSLKRHSSAAAGTKVYIYVGGAKTDSIINIPSNAYASYTIQSSNGGNSTKVKVETYSGGTSDARVYLSQLEVQQLLPNGDGNCNIKSFTLPSQIGATTIDSSSAVGRIDITMPNGSSVKTLTPTVSVAAGATYSLVWNKGTEANLDLSTKCPHYYEVTSGNNAKSWEVYFTFAASNQAAITAFSIPNQVGTSIIRNDSILVTMPYGTNVSSLTPQVIYSTGATLSPLSGTVQDFSSTVNYTVTSQDNSTSKTYKVKVSIQKNSECNITAFSIGAINGNITNDTIITLTMPTGTNVTALTPTITISAKAAVTPASGAVQDFSSKKVYNVTAENGVDKKRYHVTVNVTPATKSTECSITAFSINGVSGVISNDTVITLTMPTGTNLTALTPTITISAKATVNPASGAAQDFSSKKIYTVTAENGVSKKRYHVTVNVTPAPKSSECSIRSFKIGSVSGVITNDTIRVKNLPESTDLSALRPTILISDKATISPAADAVQDFRTAVTYTVTAENEVDSKTYIVSISKVSGPTSIEQELNEQLRIYPNPISNGELKIESGELQIKQVELYSMSGTLQFATKEHSITVSHLANGTYVVKVYFENGVALTRKITISK